MKWWEIQAELGVLVNELERQGLPPWAEVTSMFSAAYEEIQKLEYRHERIVELAADAVATSKPLPDLTEEQRLMLWIRALYAEQFVMGLSQSPRGLFPQPKLSRRRLYTWLFVELWEHAGFPTFDVLACSFLAEWPCATREQGKN